MPLRVQRAAAPLTKSPLAPTDFGIQHGDAEITRRRVLFVEK